MLLLGLLRGGLATKCAAPRVQPICWVPSAALSAIMCASASVLIALSYARPPSDRTSVAIMATGGA